MIFIYLLQPFKLQSLKKILRADPEYSLNNSGPQLEYICPFDPKKYFSINFTWVIFYAYCGLSCCKVWKKIFPVDREIKACIILGHNRTITAHLDKRRYFWKYRLTDFSPLIESFHTANWKKKLRKDPEKFFIVEMFTDTHTYRYKHTDKLMTISLL